MLSNPLSALAQRGFSFYLTSMLKLNLNQRLLVILALLSLSENSIGQNDTSIILQQVTVIDQGDPAKFLIKALRQNWRTLERSAPSNLKYYSRKYTSTNNACLLYTSPSPRDRQKSRMPSSA